MKIKRALFLGLSFFTCTLAFAQGREFSCSKAFSEMSVEYPKLVCEANEWMERGNARRALELYQRAAESSFFESPNFLIYFRIAAAQYELGNRREALETIANFEDMMALFSGEKLCSRPHEVRKLANDVMCSEAFNPESYAERAGITARRRIVAAYRDRVKVLKTKHEAATR